MTFNYTWKSWNWYSWSWHGFCEPKNTKPVDCDDKAKVCAAEDVKIDVLRNDYDKEDCKADLKIKIGETVLDQVGETVTLANGAKVTLATGNKLVYNSGDAFDHLARGEKAVDTFHYKLIDTDGAVSDGAKVNVTVCGATDTLAEIAASLPATVTLKLDILDIPPPADFLGPNYYEGLDLTITSADARLGGKTFDAYCLDAFQFAPDLGTVTANVYVAGVDPLPPGLVEKPENIDLINWVLNEDFTSIPNGEGGVYTEAEIQSAIWQLIEGSFQFLTGPGTKANVTEIVEAAEKAGDGFVPGEGDVVALIFEPVAGTSSSSPEWRQPLVIGVDFDDLKQDCVCDTSYHWC